ncbi:MAG: rhodanese-like domain-containing protein [Myxococcota bacterium]
MFRSIFASLAVLLGCADAAAPAATAPTSAPPAAAAAVRSVDVATLKADLDRGAVPLLVDVRTPDEFASGHVPGAKNVPLDQLAARLGEFGTADTEVYVVCQSGRRSASASDTLAAQGLRPVDVRGGTSAWQAAGFVVE